MNRMSGRVGPRGGWDAIVIGSGMGGLAFASLYAQLARKRVLVLEQHFVPGGFTHSFERRGFRWDVGLHYVGGMAPGSPTRALMDLVTGGQVQWQPLPDRYDVFHYPELQAAAYRTPEDYAARICQQFPEEDAAIHRYFADVAETSRTMGPQIWSWSLPAWISTPMRWIGRRAAQLSTITVSEYMRRNFRDPRLIAVLTSHWGDYGLTPDQASFATHALITASYFGGAFFPIGGGERLAKSAIAIIRQEGGDCLTGQRVDRIVVENGQAVGVQTGAAEHRAPLIVSNAGRRATLGKLLGVSAPAGPEQGTAAITLYLGLRGSPDALGVRGENHWVHETFAHKATRKIESVFVSFSSLNNPLARKHTAQIMAVVDPALFEQWSETRWKNRGQEYEAFKGELSERLFTLAEKATPGLRNLTEYHELSTPLTVRHFTGSAMIYGSPGTPQRFRDRRHTVRTGIRNLLLTGADACCLGIQGALMGGVFAAGYAIHPLTGFPFVMRASRQSGMPAATR